MTANEPVEHRLRVDGLEHCCFEWGASLRGDAPTILLVHATGFHARIWDQVIARLGSRHVISIDQRGHGRSEGGPVEHWGCFGADILAVAEQLALSDTAGVVGVGHSMGGHAIVQAAAKKPDLFGRLLLIDPVIGDPESYGDAPSHMPPGMTVHPTVKRRRFFDSPEAMFERFEERHPYSLFTKETLMDYCVYGLLPVEGGEGFELACPPEVEASVYMTSRTNSQIHDYARQVRVPVLLFRAPEGPRGGPMDFSASPTWPELKTLFSDGRERVLEDLTHFIPMQAPALVASAIEEG